MIIKPFDTYTTFARIEFTSIYGVDVTCNLKQIRSIPLQTFTATGNPVSINMLNGSETMDTIRGIECILDVHSITDFQLLNLLPDGNKDYLLEVIYDGRVVFTGFLNPDQYTEPFNTPPYASNLTFVNGISYLRDIEFADIDGCYYTGYYRDISIIGYCLSEIGISRNILDGINIFDENTDIADEYGTLFEKFKNVEAFRGMNCYEVLDNILKSYAARLDYIDDRWVIRRLRSNETTLKTFEWQMNSGGLPSLLVVVNLDNAYSLTGASEAFATRAVFRDSSQELYRLLGAKELEITQDYGRKESIIQRSLFRECDFSGNFIKDWSQLDISKQEVGGETVVNFFAINRPLSFPTRQHIETNTIDNYSTENATGDNEDLFELGIVFANAKRGLDIGRKRKVQVAGPRQTSSGDSVYSTLDQIKPREVVNIRVIPLAGQLYFGFNVAETEAFKDRYDLTDADLLGGKKLYVIFPNDDNLPIGFDSAIPYVVIPIDIVLGVYLFRLSSIDSVLTFNAIDPADELNIFPGSFVYYYFPTVLRFDGNNKLGNDGEILTNNFLTIEIPENNLAQKGFTSTGVVSTSGLLGPYTGPIYFRLEKPLNTVFTKTEFFDFFIESIRLTIIDTPENSTETIVLNSKLKNKYELNIMFAETPIKNNFINNKLKFYNNFFSLSLTTAPGLQYVKITDVDPQYTTLYDYIIQVYSFMLNKYRFAISGTIDSPELPIFARVLDDEYTGKSYMQNGCRWNLKQHSFEVDLHEIGTANEPEIKGDWNDDFNDDFNNE